MELEFKKNIICWYPIDKKQTILQIGKDDEIFEELNTKSKTVSVLDNIYDVKIDAKFDIITLIGNFENASSEEEIIEILEFAKKHLNRDGKILLAMKNKFGMKYWSGERFDEFSKPYETIANSKANVLSIIKIKNILENMKLKYKFYYPLPDYKMTNVIYTDDSIPNNESIDSRILTYCNEGEILNFSEREAYKQLVNEDKKLFPFFSNSFFIEISNKDKFENIKYVSFGVTRKKEYRIKTIIKEHYVYKSANNDKANEHISNISKNIDILKKCNIDCLDEYKNGEIVSKYLKDAISYDKLVMEVYNKNGLDKAIEKINEFNNNVLNKLLIENETNGINVFDKYNVKLPDYLKQELHFTSNGVIDLIFQNCLVKGKKAFAYDQEWYEENVPVEFILYRAILYFTELREKEDFEKLLRILNLERYAKYFKELEDKLQEKILDKQMWDKHVKSFNCIKNTRDIIECYEKQLNMANEHIENLEKLKEEYEKGINDLTKLVQDKDVQLVNYANELRGISNSLSWKITKPVRIFVWMFNPRSGASFIDRIMPPGGKRRIEYDKKQTEKKYAKKVENYFKLSDEETAEYWKGIDHRKYLKYEKDLEKAKEDEFSDYEKWINAHTPSDQEIEKQEKTRFKKRPKISIVVPLYNTDTEFFRELLYTVHCQTYKNWELCLADGSEKPLEKIKSMCANDKRIKYKFLGENKGISENTNKAIEMATGDYISLLDHDDMLDISALYEVVKVINENKDVDFIYSDEDKFHFIDEPRYAPHFKPDYAPDTLRANNYICHYSVFKRELLEKIGGFNSEYDGAQDFDLILRATENAKKIVHIQKVLYHWRVHKSSTAMDSEAKPYAIIAGQKAVEAHLKRVGLSGKVSEGAHPGTYKIEYDVIGKPKVSILIPNKDESETLRNCINSIVSKSTYTNYEIVIIENNSEQEETFEYYKELLKGNYVRALNANLEENNTNNVSQKIENDITNSDINNELNDKSKNEVLLTNNKISNIKIRIINYNTDKEISDESEASIEYTNKNKLEDRRGFNYSSIINFGVKNVDGDFVVQLNNDTEVLTSNWLEQMIGFAQREDVGAVGVKLYYPDETIQHAGIIVGARTVAAHMFRGLRKDEQGYFGREDLIQNMNAVTAACIMTKREIYEQVGFMNEEFAVAFNDIDFCLKIRNLGKLIVYNPFVEFIHYESKTRGDDNAPDKLQRFQGEIKLFLDTWKEKLEQGDEYYNKSFRLESDQYDLKL